MTICEDTDLIFDIRLFVSLVNWHFTFLLEHSVQLELSVASHYSGVSTVVQSFPIVILPTFTLRSRQASQLGSFLR